MYIRRVIYNISSSDWCSGLQNPGIVQGHFGRASVSTPRKDISPRGWPRRIEMQVQTTSGVAYELPQHCCKWSHCSDLSSSPSGLLTTAMGSGFVLQMVLLSNELVLAKALILGGISTSRSIHTHHVVDNLTGHSYRDEVFLQQASRVNRVLWPANSPIEYPSDEFERWVRQLLRQERNTVSQVFLCNLSRSKW